MKELEKQVQQLKDDLEKMKHTSFKVETPSSQKKGTLIPGKAKMPHNRNRSIATKSGQSNAKSSINDVESN